METLKGLAPHPHAVVKNSGGLPQEWGVPVPHQGPQPRVPMSGELLVANTGGNWVGERKYWSPKQFLLKNLHTDLLRLTPSELQV